MKKIFLFVLLVLFIPNVSALNGEKVEVNLINCDSVYNIWINEGGQDKRISLIAYSPLDGEYNDAINQFVCTSLQKANKIEIEYDLAKKDQYNREVVWVFTDGELLQNSLIRMGYGQVSNIQDNYQYLDELCKSEYNAIAENIGIWTYPNIKENYCKSDLPIGQKTVIDKKEEVKKEKKIDIQYLIILSSGILLLLIILVLKGNKNGKR